MTFKFSQKISLTLIFLDQNPNEFSHDVREIFIPVDDDSNIHKPSSAPSSLSSPSSQKSSLNFILNEEERGESSEIQNWDNVDPDSLINLPSDELQRKQ